MGVLFFKGLECGDVKNGRLQSPLDKGGKGREWGDSARAGIRELWFSDWHNTNCTAKVHKCTGFESPYPLSRGEGRELKGVGFFSRD